jgi:AmmeMemoRadiSam system protein B
MQEAVRQPVVAGMFYPGTEHALRRQLESLIVFDPNPHQCLGCIAPHAGYVYSGQVAGRLYGHLVLPRRIIVLGPNHTGGGVPISVAPEPAWGTPLGDVPIDQDLRRGVLDQVPAARSESGAHRREHSIEVQLPFLKLRRPDLTVLPVVLAHLDLDDCLSLGEALATVVVQSDEPVAIVASSDMTHYEPDAEARERDALAIEAVLSMNPGQLFETVHRHRITMCGVVPATVLLAALRILGAESGHLQAYQTSGDTSGDRSAVVGYAGVCFPA